MWIRAFACIVITACLPVPSEGALTRASAPAWHSAQSLYAPKSQALADAVPAARHKPRASLTVVAEEFASHEVLVTVKSNAERVRVKFVSAAEKRVRTKNLKRSRAHFVLPAGARSVRVRALATHKLAASHWATRIRPIAWSSPSQAPTPIPTSTQTPSSSTSTPLPTKSLAQVYRVVGNRIVDPDGRDFVPHGVARPSLEWSCSGQALEGSAWIPASEFRMLRDSWRANAMRIGLNESFWLGSTGRQPQNPCPGYVSAVESVVDAARSLGLVVILDLHWSDAGDPSRPAAQHCSPDRSSGEFWQSVATTFGADSGVWFELYNEPHDISWEVWLNGGGVVCSDGTRYQAPGMQQLLDVIRASRTSNIVLIGGLDWAYDLSGVPLWRPAGENVAYATHPYSFKGPAEDWDRAFGTLASYAPVIATEFGRTTCDVADPYDTELLDYFRAHGIGYTAWAWWVGGCGFPSLVSDADGTCTRGGCAVRRDLTALASGELGMTQLPSRPFPEFAGPSVQQGFEDGTDGWSNVWGDCLSVAGTALGGRQGGHRLSLRQTGPGYCAVGTRLGLGMLQGGALVELRVWLPENAPPLMAEPFVMDSNWSVRKLGTVTLLPGWNRVRATVPSDVTSTNVLGVQTNNPSWTGDIGLDDVAW